jgi:hypothetical protein
MDEILVSVISGLIVNAISSAATVMRNRFLPNSQEEKPNLTTDTRSLIIPASARLREKIAPANLDNVTQFLRSPEAEILFRHYFITLWANQLAQEEDYLKEQTAAFLYLTYNVPLPTAATAADALHRLFLELAESTVSVIERSDSYFHEGIRSPSAIADLRTLQRTTEFLRQLSPEHVASIVRFETLYRDLACQKHRLITPPSWDSRKPIPIDDIYVSPMLEEEESLRSKLPDARVAIDIERLLQATHRAVILGNPGAGKSTLIEKLMYDLSQDRLRHNRSAPSIPFRVVLRDYASNKILHNTSLLEHITIRVKTDYMVDIPERFVEYYLEIGRGIVLFDGLDELVEAHRRQEIVSDVRAFSARYGSVPIIVTSRSVGYEEAPLPSDEYVRYHLRDFDDDQVEEYSRKWFSLSADITVREKAQLAEAFLIESTSVRDLRSNPLMLALLCNIYRGERHIPRNRVDVYRRCSIMLFERWDKDRGITVSLPFITHIRYAIAYLAEWIYSNQDLQSGVREADLITKTTAYLFGRIFDTEEEAEAAATDFVNFCRGRAWVFTDVGGELYQFSHRTFLEYFTALSVSRRVAAATEFWADLRPRLARNEWDMVAQLALAMFDESHEGGADQVLSLLLDDVTMLAPEIASNLFGWALRSMAAVVPTPSIRRRIAQVLIDRVIESIPVSDQAVDLYEITMLLSLLSQAASENIPSMADELFTRLRQKVLSDDLGIAAQSSFLILVLSELKQYSQTHGEDTFHWFPYIEDADVRLNSRLRELATKYLLVGTQAYRMSYIDIDSLIASHELTSLFISVTSVLDDGTVVIFNPTIDTIVSSTINRGKYRESKGHSSVVARAIAHGLLKGARINRAIVQAFKPDLGRGDDIAQIMAADSAFEFLDADEKICVWFPFAASVEGTDYGIRVVSKLSYRQGLASTLHARGRSTKDQAMGLATSVFGSKYEQIITSWIMGESVFGTPTDHMPGRSD